jgi:hypothetical protein
VDPEDPNRPRVIGPEQIVHLSDPNAKPFYLTYGGEGLASIEHELTSLKEDMAYLGANMLASKSSMNETATKSVIRRANETSTLSVIADNGSQTLTKALQEMAIWCGEKHPEDIAVVVNNDFDPVKLGANELLALVSTWQDGAISKESLFFNLQEGEIVPGERDFDEEEELISNQMPTGSPSGDE